MKNGDKIEYPNKTHCWNCFNYNNLNKCNALFGPEIVGYGAGNEHCIRRDVMSLREIIKLKRYTSKMEEFDEGTEVMVLRDYSGKPINL